MRLLLFLILLFLSVIDSNLKAQTTIPEDSLNGFYENKAGYLFVSTLNISLSPKDQSVTTFTINSNVQWTITCSDTWFNTNPVNGVNVKKVTVTGNSNPTNQPRVATITVSGEGVAAQVITLTQAAGPIGIEQVELSELKISPNPTQDFLFLKGFSKEAVVSIFDVNGKLLMQKANDESSFDVQALAFGIYTLKIVDAGKVFTRKIVKQ